LVRTSRRCPQRDGILHIPLRERYLDARQRRSLQVHLAYVDDLMIASKDPDSIIKILMEKYQFKLKGTGPTEFHLGCDFFRDEEGVLCYAPKKYIEKILENYRWIFGTWPKPATSPLTTGDHPELDTSELLNEDDQKAYQSLIGALQWVIQIGCFDI